MPYNYGIIFLSLCLFNSSLAVDNSPPPIKPFDESDILELIHNALSAQQHNHYHQHHHHHYPQQQETTLSATQSLAFTELDMKKMSLVFKSSPKEARFIVNHLQNPTFFPLNEDYRSAIFVGEPGSGKTTMAKAIAHKMIEHGWEYKIISSTSLLGEQRNHTAMRLERELDAIKASKKPTILIIDELNLLLENSESKHHDTDATSKALWMFLDQQSGNKDFFFIGTMNRINKLPKPYKNRILPDCIKFPLMTDSTIKMQFLRDYLTNPHTMLDKEVTDDFLIQEVEKMGDSSGRDLENISKVICRTSKINQTTPSSPLIIKQAAITYATDQYLRQKMESNYNLEEETDEERQNRHHKENMDMQQIHFVQQQIIQASANPNSDVYTGNDVKSGLNLHYTHYKDGIKKEYSLISDEQKKLYNDMMKKTREKETIIEKEAEEERKKWPWQRKTKQ